MNTKHRVLYLEDDEQLGQLTLELLKKAGFKVTWLRDGQQGLAEIKKQVFDISIADIMMPNMDGYTFVSSLRASGNPIPVIFLSARILSDDVIKGFSVGGNDYMRKPFSTEELIVRMNYLLDKNEANGVQDKTIAIGSYSFNYASYSLQIGCKQTQLSSRSADLLHRMVTDKNHVLDKKKALIEFWGDDNFFNGRSLDVFISKLRKMLSEDERIRIVNLRAVGYKLIIADDNAADIS